jgi:5-methylcytosine-specific restriction endonuclease McrA
MDYIVMRAIYSRSINSSTGKGECFYCKREIIEDHYGSRQIQSGWEVDHKVPKNKGGTNSEYNLVAACWECNLGKGTKSVNEWLQILSLRRLIGER